jgi:hypothetical protein
MMMLNDILTGKASVNPDPPPSQDPYRKAAVEQATCTGCGKLVVSNAVRNGHCPTCARVAEQAVAQAMSARYQQQAYQLHSMRVRNDDYAWVIRLIVYLVFSVIVVAARCSMVTSHSHYYY